MDGAGLSPALLQWIARPEDAAARFRWEHSTGWAFTDREQGAVEKADRMGLWQSATNADGHAREDAFVADLTGLLGGLCARPAHHKERKVCSRSKRRKNKANAR